MRLLLLSLLALGAHAQVIGHRSLLQAYSPARGEFPVRSELAQGYLRYLDNTGAERLVAYAYPEPLFGIRSEHHVLQQPSVKEQVNSALRSSFADTQESQKAAAPVLTPEVQQARDEHLRIWKEAAHAAHSASAADTLKEIKPQPVAMALNYIAQAPPTPVEETQEVYRARQEHLRLYNEALQLQSQPKDESQAVKSITYQNIEQSQAPQPVEETPEVKFAREEHLRQYNEAILRQSALPQQQTASSSATSATKTGIVELYAPLTGAEPQPLAGSSNPLPMVTIKSTIPNDPQPIGNIASSVPLAQTVAPTALNTRSSFADVSQSIQPVRLPVAQFPRLPIAQTATHEQQIEFLSKAKLTAEDRVADIDDRIRLEEREREAERLRDLEQRREEQQQAELERQREEQRLIEERNQLEAERIALQQQEKQRLEGERQEELKRLQTEQQLDLQLREQQQKAQLQQDQQQQLKTNVEQIFKAPAAAAKPQPAAGQPQTISQQQQVQNGFFLRIQAAQPAAQPAGAPASAEELSSNAYLLAEQTHNPFLLRYIQKSISEPASTGYQSAYIAPISIPINKPLSDGISELEQRYREHFETHLKAFEQLRRQQKHDPIVTPCQ